MWLIDFILFEEIFERCKTRFQSDEDDGKRRVTADRFDFKKKKNVCQKQHDEMANVKLLKEGFDFDYHTHHVISKIKKNELIFCFDYGYRRLPGEKVKIIKAFEYKEE